MYLDRDIQRDTDRLEYVKKILDEMQEIPTTAQLEAMANYILYGKDTEGKNAVQRREITDTEKKNKTWTRKDEENLSLDAMLEVPGADQLHFQDFQKRNPYVKKLTPITTDDLDIPGMADLRDGIQYLARVLAIAQGKIPHEEGDPVLSNSQHIYILQHWLIDLRRHQYYLKDAYRPAIHFQTVPTPRPQKIDFTQDSFYWIAPEEYERRRQESLLPLPDPEWNEDHTAVKWIIQRQTVDFTNPAHIRALFDFYSDIYEQDWEDPYSWGRILLMDFDALVDRCNFSEERLYILIRKIDKATVEQIVGEIKEKFGLGYAPSHVSSIINKELPQKIALLAEREKMQFETPLAEKKKCKKCGNYFPANTLFFGRHTSRPDGLTLLCKGCERLRRIERGEQTNYDRRYRSQKDAIMLKMPTNVTPK